MTLILAKPNQSLFTFYCRRIKRIFPTCLLIIALTLGIGSLILLPSHFAFLQKEAIWASTFVNNFSSMVSRKHYFELVTKFRD